jgi:hypothetical protein
MSSEMKSAIEAAVQEADKAAADWLGKRKGIADEITTLLDRRVQEIIGKLLGFDAHWGEWEVDHCNGRSGNSAAGDWLRGAVQGAVGAWLTAQAGKLPTLPKAAIKSLRGDYLEAFQNELRDRLIKKAKEDASEAFQQVIEDYELCEVKKGETRRLAANGHSANETRC